MTMPTRNPLLTPKTGDVLLIHGKRVQVLEVTAGTIEYQTPDGAHTCPATRWAHAVAGAMVIERRDLSTRKEYE
jgi:hypothetical protein